jgi:hypothetical protein
MKNIHLIKTDKPSRLFYNVGGALLFRNYENHNGVNIYITSDEEIKDVDYRLNIQRDYFKKSDKEGLDYYNKRNDIFKKIILTTDLELQKDGVQAIDDEFLEWFVKNPSCEGVATKLVEFEVDMGLGNSCIEYGSYYKITYALSEPKQELERSITIIDPPSGWKYGFPKPIPEDRIEDVLVWLVEQGYPQSEIDGLGEIFTNCCRYWEQEEQTNQVITKTVV